MEKPRQDIEKGLDGGVTELTDAEFDNAVGALGVPAPSVEALAQAVSEQPRNITSAPRAIIDRALEITHPEQAT